MARVKGGVTAAKRRRNIRKAVKGYRFDRGKKTRAAREAIYHAQTYAFAHRKDKKNDFRRLWIVRLNAALRESGITYRAFIRALKEKEVVLDRKIRATLTKDRPQAFARVFAYIK